MAATSPAVRPRAQARSRVWTWALGAVVAVALVAIAVPLFYAGSPDKLANGTRIAGIDVGGLAPGHAQRLLEQRAARLATAPVPFTAGTRRFSITPKTLGIEVDWADAVRTAEQQGRGFAIARGYKRLELEFFPADLTPSIRAYDAALDYELTLLGK